MLIAIIYEGRKGIKFEKLPPSSDLGLMTEGRGFKRVSHAGGSSVESVAAGGLAAAAESGELYCVPAQRFVRAVRALNDVAGRLADFLPRHSMDVPGRRRRRKSWS
ncbi:hypothetical protein HDV57DRAFT_484181 [Trichoderma longibrachiatum]